MVQAVRPLAVPVRRPSPGLLFIFKSSRAFATIPTHPPTAALLLLFLPQPPSGRWRAADEWATRGRLALRVGGGSEEGGGGLRRILESEFPAFQERWSIHSCRGAHPADAAGNGPHHPGG